jgi:hypothetical protein
MDILVINVLLSRVFMPIRAGKLHERETLSFASSGCLLNSPVGAIKKLFKTKTLVLVFEVLFEETRRVSSKNCLGMKQFVS